MTHVITTAMRPRRIAVVAAVMVTSIAVLANTVSPADARTECGATCSAPPPPPPPSNARGDRVGCDGCTTPPPSNPRSDRVGCDDCKAPPAPKQKLVRVYRNTYAYSTPYLNARSRRPLRAATYVATCEANSGSRGRYSNPWWSRLRDGTWVNNGDLRGGAKMRLGDCSAPPNDNQPRGGRVGCDDCSAPSPAPQSARTPPTWRDCLTTNPSLARGTVVRSFAVRERSRTTLRCGTHHTRQGIRRGAGRKLESLGFGVRHIHADHGYNDDTNGCIARVLHDYQQAERDANKDIYTYAISRVVVDGGAVYGLSVHGLTARVVVDHRTNKIITAYTAATLNGVAQPGSGSWYGCASGIAGGKPVTA